MLRLYGRFFKCFKMCCCFPVVADLRAHLAPLEHARPTAPTFCSPNPALTFASLSSHDFSIDSDKTDTMHSGRKLSQVMSPLNAFSPQSVSSPPDSSLIPPPPPRRHGDKRMRSVARRFLSVGSLALARGGRAAQARNPRPHVQDLRRRRCRAVRARRVRADGGYLAGSVEQSRVRRVRAAG